MCFTSSKSYLGRLAARARLRVAALTGRRVPLHVFVVEYDKAVVGVGQNGRLKRVSLSMSRKKNQVNLNFVSIFSINFSSYRPQVNVCQAVAQKSYTLPCGDERVRGDEVLGTRD